ncbi:hypothetical protein BN1708_000981 [Verticillium longisporum]|uniref:Mitochondrial import inner membrane translocase subunit n=2 Tax=Verticillium longisporum TaxID=100787 RepID=A0A0G4L9W1_VERLO|nr:Mitochondrial import inner membrane translocase subunit tim9 like protein [Verticillium longisporum]CRK18510.1 hypothetical protein BN1708_012364 [Verticillium longisporum]CRK30466.1 hypothetical protein BN1708_000981 [Verticillium longisporum]
MEGLTRTEEAMLQQRLQKRQVKEFMNIFGNVVDHCFNACIDDFTSKTLSSRENGCITRCVQKQMFSRQRLSERFQEHNAEMTAKMQQQ